MRYWVCLVGGLCFALSFFLSLQVFAEASPQDIHDQRLAEEANSIISPSPMQTVSAAQKPISAQNSAATQSSATTAHKATPTSGTKPAAPTPALTLTPNSNTPLGVMAYYQNLIDCKKGIFEFDNPAYSGSGQKQSITTSIEGLQSGYCQVNVYLSHSSMAVNCLFSTDDRKALADKKAMEAFSDAYANGNMDSSNPTLYDKIVSKVCQAE